MNRLLQAGEPSTGWCVTAAGILLVCVTGLVAGFFALVAYVKEHWMSFQ